jgi:membrane protein
MAPGKVQADDRFPLWITVLTIGLLASGFSRISYTAPANPRQLTNTGSANTNDERGRSASSPSEIPALGWKDIILRIYRNLSKDRLIVIAAGVTFYVLLAIFPAVAALVSLYGLFADPITLSTHVDSLRGLIPEGAVQIVHDQMTRVAAQRNALGFAFVIGFLLSLWSANAGVKALFDALNLVYSEEEERGFLKLDAISLAFTLAAIVFLLLAIGVVVALPIAFKFVGLESATETIVYIVRWPILFIVVALALACLYRYGPSRRKPQWRWTSWGSAFAALVWLAISILFSWYAAHFGSFNKTYGSLGAVIGFMVWIWISIIVVLIGAEIDAEIEHQTARDTTTGAPKPMGARGATMADTLGSAQS